MKTKTPAIPKANPERVKLAITAMERVRDMDLKVDMRGWQRREAFTKPVKTLENAKECGTVCCFAGWLAISPEFANVGGEVDWNGAPIFGGDNIDYSYGSRAVANFLGIDCNNENDDDYVALMCGLDESTASGFSGRLYNKRAISRVNMGDIVQNLHKLLEAQALELSAPVAS